MAVNAYRLTSRCICGLMSPQRVIARGTVFVVRVIFSIDVRICVRPVRWLSHSRVAPLS
jgi:hypothetical protein